MKTKKFLAICMIATLLMSLCSFSSSAIIMNETGITKEQVNIRSGPGTRHSLVYENLPKGVMVVILEQVNCDDGTTSKPWYKIEFNYGGKFYENCYASSGLITIVQETTQDVPEEYKPYISALQAKHPEWKFEFFHTGLDWNEVLKNEDERVMGRNLIAGSRPKFYRSPIAYKNGQEVQLYNSETDYWIPLDGKSWYQAKSAVVAHYMDPRNFLSTENNVFQFELLSYDSSTQTLEGVQKMLEGTFMDNVKIETEAPNPNAGDVTGDGTVDISDALRLFQYVSGKIESLNGISENADINGDGDINIADALRVFQYVSGTIAEIEGPSEQITYAEAFIRAAEITGVSPYHLVARVIQEVGRNGSDSVSGTRNDYPGIYNYYNIGASASSDPVANGLNWASTPSENEAYMRPWNTRYKALVGGAIFIGKKYINAGQNTQYFEKFDVESEFNGLYWHQYMGNIEAAQNEGRHVYNNYQNMGLLSNSFTFRIPIYNNLPQKPCELPTS